MAGQSLLLGAENSRPHHRRLQPGLLLIILLLNYDSLSFSLITFDEAKPKIVQREP